MTDDERRPVPTDEPTAVTSFAERLLAPIFALFAALIGGILGGLMTAFARAFGLKEPEPPDDEPG